MNERFVDAHERRYASSLEPGSEIGDRLKIEGPVLVVDRAVIEAGRLDDPRNTARGELLEAGPERCPPFAHGPANAVLFHGSLQVRAERSSILTSDLGSRTGRNLDRLRRCDDRIRASRWSLTSGSADRPSPLRLDGAPSPRRRTVIARPGSGSRTAKRELVTCRWAKLKGYPRNAKERAFASHPLARRRKRINAVQDRS